MQSTVAYYSALFYGLFAALFDKRTGYGQNNILRLGAPIRGDVAQLGEHYVRNVGVEGSNPFISTTETYRLGITPGLFLFCD